MSLTLRRRHVNIFIPETWLGRMKTQAFKASTKVSPMARNARKVTAHRVLDARVWAAPKLEHAAHTVEDRIAPRVSSILSEAARRVDPSPRGLRRLPVLLFLAGAALGAVGVAIYRGNAQRWTHIMKDTMRETASETGKWAGEKTEQAGRQIGETTEQAASRIGETTEEAGKRIGETADEISGRRPGVSP